MYCEVVEKGEVERKGKRSIEYIDENGLLKSKRSGLNGM